ncbi:ribonuclease P family protein [Wolffia australiana]
MSTEVISDQRKRALDALERRFSASKPESSQEPNHNKRKTGNFRKKKERKDEDGGRGAEVASTSAPDHVSSLKKGNFVFQGKFGSSEVSNKDSEVSRIHPAYRKLSVPVHPNLMRPPPENPGAGAAIVNNVIHDLLQKGDSSEKYMQGSRNMKIDNWLLLDNHIPRSEGLEDARVKAIQSHSNRSKNRMSMRQHHACGSFALPQRFWKFEAFKPMHDMWKEYILNLLKEKRKHTGQIFLSADLHGAFLFVVECKGGNFTGVSGIMIRETKETFGIITPDDKFKVVPKKICVFQLQAANLKLTLFGDKLSTRNTY